MPVPHELDEVWYVNNTSKEAVGSGQAKSTVHQVVATEDRHLLSLVGVLLAIVQ